MHDTLYFSDHHLHVRDMVLDFAEQVVKPTARRYDLESKFPWDNVKQMAELGLFGIPWPEALGGSGMDYLSYIIVIHELAKVDASHAITVSAHTTLGTSPIVDFGTEEQKRRYVPRLAAGKVLGGFGLTETGAGSDAGGTKTVAVDRGDHYVLNGSKIFITNAGVGEIFVVSARTDPAAPQVPGCDGGKEGRQARLARLGHARAGVPGCDRTQGERARSPERRLPPVPPHAGRRSHRPRRPGTRHRGRRAGGVPAVHGDAPTIRQTDRELPGRPLRAGGHGHGDRGGQAPGVSRRLAQAARPAVQTGGRDGQALRLGARDARDDEGRPAARRVRLHDGVPGRTDDAGREDLRDRGRDERDPADRDCEAVAWRFGGLAREGAVEAITAVPRPSASSPPLTALHRQISHQKRKP